jgi:hypothetical protein
VAEFWNPAGAATVDSFRAANVLDLSRARVAGTLGTSSPCAATPAQRQRHCYVSDRLSGSSSPVSELARISDSQAWTAATTASFSATVGP